MLILFVSALYCKTAVLYTILSGNISTVWIFICGERCFLHQLEHEGPPSFLFLVFLSISAWLPCMLSFLEYRLFRAKYSLSYLEQQAKRLMCRPIDRSTSPCFDIPSGVARAQPDDRSAEHHPKNVDEGADDPRAPRRACRVDRSPMPMARARLAGCPGNLHAWLLIWTTYMPGWLHICMHASMPVCPRACISVSLYDWLPCWQNCLAAWLPGRLYTCMPGWLSDCLAGWLAGFLRGWLACSWLLPCGLMTDVNRLGAMITQSPPVCCVKKQKRFRPSGTRRRALGWCKREREGGVESERVREGGGERQ